MKNGRGAPRSRTGCKRCKERRFKCDEEKPECGRCQAAGLACPGYNQSLKWSTKHEVFESKKRRLHPSDLDTPQGSSLPNGSDRLHVSPRGESIYMTEPPSLSVSTPNVPDAPRSTLVETPMATNPAACLEETYSPDMMQHNPFLAEAACLTANSLGTSFYGEPSELGDHAEVEEVNSSPAFISQVDLKPGLQESQALVQRQPFLPVPTRGPSDFSSALVEYYFKETAGVFSCYDSSLNPFRTTVANFWTMSPALHRTLQSMAAACLVNESPYFRRICRSLRTEALSLLFNAPDQDETSLLALLMLGQSSSWFDPQDLGIPLFKTLKSKLNQGQPAQSAQLTRVIGDRGFFHEALEYWEMLLSFVSSEVTIDATDGPWPSSNAQTRKLPHPWTGICRETQMLVNQVGQLVRAERIRARSTRFTWQHSIDESINSLQLARYLELRLKSLSEPQDDQIVSPGDTETPVWHLQRIAEIYRRTGLINLYRVFPDLLLQQINEQQAPGMTSNVFQADILDSDNWLGLVEEGQSSSDQSESMYAWLTNFAIETIDLLESIPASSGTRCLQPFMLVVCASELRAPPLEDEPFTDVHRLNGAVPSTTSMPDTFSWPQMSFSTSFGSQGAGFSLPSSNDSPTPVDEKSLSQAFRVFHARRFVRGRLNLFMNVLPPRPTKTCLDLVEAVWNKLDDGDEDIYWIDVMMDKGLHTTMG